MSAEIKIPRSVFEGMAGFTSTDAARPGLTGVHVTPQGVSATDSYILAHIAHDFDCDFAPVILSPASVKNIIKSAGKNTDVTLTIDGDAVSALCTNKNGSLTVACEVIDGSFPDVAYLLGQSVGDIPTDAEHIATVSAALLARMAASCDKMCRWDAHPTLRMIVGTRTQPLRFTFESTFSGNERDGIALLMPFRDK